MATCLKCGKKLSLFFNNGSYCEECSFEIQKEEEKKRDLKEKELVAKNQQLKELKEKQQNELLESQVNQIKTDVINGKDIYFYKKLYLPVDSLVNNEVLSSPFDISDIQTLGLDGWEIVSIVPKTIGVGLKNTSIGSTTGQTWGGGLGGNVIGVYVLLKKKASINNQALEQEIKEYILPFIKGEI